MKRQVNAGNATVVGKTTLRISLRQLRAGYFEIFENAVELSLPGNGEGWAGFASVQLFCD
jgi:hypothetical protein